MPAPSVAYLLLRQLWEAVHKQPNILHVFICPKFMILVLLRLLFNMDYLGVYGPPGGGGGGPQFMNFLLLVLFFP